MCYAVTVEVFYIFFRSTLLSFLFDFLDTTAVSLRHFYIDSANIISGEFDRLVLNT